ncbi:MAG: phytoene desaturase family protein [Salibacteraceae bacterium]
MFSLLRMKVSIIGAGIGALALSIRLAKAGHEVHVFEANSYVGGKLHRFTLGDYAFDGGPSLFTMPHYVTELFDLAGVDHQAYFDYEKLEESCRYFWEDGSRLTGYSDPARFSKAAQESFNIPEATVQSYFDHTKNIYNHSGKIFLEKSLHKANTWLSKETLNSMLKIGQFDLFKSMNRANKIRLGEPHLVQLFNRFATYNGSNPFVAPGILNVIPWFEHGFGTFAPKGGMQEIPNSLHALAQKLNVSVHLNTPVDRIMLLNNKAIGVETAGAQHLSDVVVSNADVYFTYTKMLPKSIAPSKTLKQERSSSAVVYYWGIDTVFDQLNLHNILFSDNYQKEFQELFDEHRLPEDPTIYINISSKVNANDAPDGKENWFVMINAPSHTGQDWEIETQNLKTRVIQKINRILKTDIAAHIVEERIWTPQGIEEDTRSYQGSLYGTSSNNQMAAFLRHPNFSTKLKNLYFCGGSVHPGGGIPLALLSARITSDLILNG